MTNRPGTLLVSLYAIPLALMAPFLWCLESEFRQSAGMPSVRRRPLLAFWIAASHAARALRWTLPVMLIAPALLAAAGMSAPLVLMPSASNMPTLSTIAAAAGAGSLFGFAMFVLIPLVMALPSTVARDEARFA